MPPSEYRTIAKDALLRKFEEEGWPSKLLPYDPPVVRHYGLHKTVKKWMRGLDVIAEVREYTNPGAGGPQKVVCQLRDGDVMFFIP